MQVDGNVENPAAPVLLRDVFVRLTELREDLEKMGVTYLAVFGSVARNAAGPDSDVDLLFELDRPAGMFTLVRLARHLEEKLGRSVDLVRRPALTPCKSGRLFPGPCLGFTKDDGITKGNENSSSKSAINIPMD
jgi:predicted nucleotidyltransferase